MVQDVNEEQIDMIQINYTYISVTYLQTIPGISFLKFHRNLMKYGSCPRPETIKVE